MARRKRLCFPNAVYHVTSRGNNRQDILALAEDKVIFLKALRKFKVKLSFKLYGLVLMDNHAHLLIRAAAQFNISKIMQAVSLSFSYTFRKKYHCSGYVWQGRFGSEIISDDSYLFNCLEYMHNNPVRAGIVDKPGDYPWSSYHFYNNLPDPLKDYIRLNRFKE